MSWGKASILICGQLVVILLMVPSSWMERVIQIENEWMDVQMGGSSANWVRSNARRAYDTAVIDSGLMDGTYYLLLPSRQQRAQSGAMSGLGTRIIFPYVRDRLETTFMVVYQSLSRLVLLIAWAPFAALLLIPAIIDGLVSWRIRKTTFDFASPTINHYALTATGGLCTLMVVAVTAPVPVPPIALPIAVILLCPAIYFAVSHTSKRL